jgi:serine/threonine-protein kinase
MTDAAASDDPLLERLRAVLGAQFSIERRLGQGGMGSVYLARDATLDRLVAIKVISPDVASSAALRDRFLQEARAVARLRHPNIVPVYSAGEVEGIAYFVMEYVPGESLRDLLVRERRVPGAHAERVLVEIALALDHAHAQGLVHRDVKPENILLDAESGRAMLTDFGVARAFEQDGGLTQTGMILGSPRYMAPEQASGERALDGRVDLYALALVGYEMFAGEPVVASGTVASMLVKHLTETPAPLETRAADVSPHVARAIAHGLEKDPANRWQRGRDFAEAISGHSFATPAPGSSGEVAMRAATGAMARTMGGGGSTSAASATSTGAGTTSPAGLGRTGRWLAAGAALAVAAVGGWFALGRDALGEDAGAAYLVTPFEVQSGDASVGWLREGSVNMLTLTLGQWSDLKVVDYERTLSLLDAARLAEKPRLSLDDARALARRAGAGTVVTGQVQTTPDSLIVIARLFDVRSGAARQQAQHSARLGDDPRPLFDRLAQSLLAIAGGPAPGVQLASATTTSLQAYRAYLEGVRLLNTWQLADADSAFARAIALDSSFALAFHKRSLGLGWGEVGGPLYRETAARAYALAGRLPPREKALVEGHYHLTSGLSNVSQPSAPELQRAIETYRALLARDSLVAEAWYGLADAYFHARSPQAGLDSNLAYTTRSLRGFHRTLAIDSTLHLAYSHLVQLYNQAANPQSGLLLAGDSMRVVTTPQQALSPEAEQQREQARSRGLEIARAWARADQRSVQSVVQLAESFNAAGLHDSARAVLQDAIGKRPGGDVVLRTGLLSYQVLHGDTGATATLRYVLDRYTGDSLRQIPVSSRFSSTSFILSAAGVSGRAADVDRAVALVLATDSTFPFSRVPLAPTVRLAGAMLKVAQGEPASPALVGSALAAMRAIDATPPPFGDIARANALSIPLLGYLASRDTAFVALARRWSRTPLTEFDALIAIERGDTASAERIAAAFPMPDSLRAPGVRLGAGGLRSIARAEALARLGLHARAAETYEVIEPHRVSSVSTGEPGFTVMVRATLERARLWARAGEPERARRAYEEFIARWRDADGAAARQVAAARAELAALRDAPRATAAPVR